MRKVTQWRVGKNQQIERNPTPTSQVIQVPGEQLETSMLRSMSAATILTAGIFATLPLAVYGGPLADQLGNLPILGGFTGAGGPLVTALREGRNGSGFVLRIGDRVLIGHQLDGKLATPLPGLGRNDGLPDIALLDGDGSGKGAIGIGILGSNRTGLGDRIAGIAALSGDDSGNGGAIGVGVLNRNRTGNGKLLGLAALSGNDSGNGGEIGIGLLNRNRTGNGDFLGLAALSGNNAGNSRQIGIGILNGDNTGNGGSIGIAALSGRNAGNGGRLSIKILNEDGELFFIGNDTRGFSFGELVDKLQLKASMVPPIDFARIALDEGEDARLMPSTRLTPSNGLLNTRGITGFIGDETVDVSGMGLFEDRDVGQDRLIDEAEGDASAEIIGDARPNVAQVQTRNSEVAIRNSEPFSITRAAPATRGMLDFTPALDETPFAQGSTGLVNFESVPLRTMSPASVASLLNARAALMKDVLRQSLAKLEDDPSLADEEPCVILKEAIRGTCLMTEALKAQVIAAQGKSSATPAAPESSPPSEPSKPQTSTPAVVAPVAEVPELPPPLFGTPRVKSAALPEIRRKVAVVIGIGRYEDSAIPGLANAVGDAQAVAATLSRELGYETLVLDNPSKAALIGTLNRLALEIAAEDSAIIFYAGHGYLVESTGAGYWLMSTSQAQDPKTWTSNADIARLIQLMGAQQVALISDSCYSGSLVGAGRIRGAPGELVPADVLARRSHVVMSSGGNEPVFDSGRGGHSLFAWSLMNTLSEVKTWSSGGKMFERIRFTVARELPQRPQYGAAPGYQEGGEYLFEVRELDAQSSNEKSPG
ncbi:MAG: caspase family protein [Panacagrimonas sp.]